MTRRQYSIVPGFFFQDQEATRPLGVPVPPSLGLIDLSANRWRNFKARLGVIQAEDRDSEYKVVFFGRHGQGHHNVAEAKYGRKAWDDYWAKLETDGVIVWGPDPLLTTFGEEQARDANLEWKKQVEEGIPLPTKVYSSPLRRALRTNQLTFDDILPAAQQVLVVEECREQYADHTCDKRSSHSIIAESFHEPRYVFEDGFTEADELYTGREEDGETKADVAARAKRVLDRIFTLDQNDTYISITAHNSIINGFLEVLGSPWYLIPTGGVLPLVIKAVPE